MSTAMAKVRHDLEKVEGISRTWFEWTWEDSAWVKTLVVEVEFDTDPGSFEFNRHQLDEVYEAASRALRGTTMTVSHLRVVPKK